MIRQITESEYNEVMDRRLAEWQELKESGDEHVLRLWEALFTRDGELVKAKWVVD